MLKKIPSILSPELLKNLMETGHGDEIVIADGNFPAASLAQRLVRLDGHDIPEVLEAVLEFFPLDIYVNKPVILMQIVSGDRVETPIWNEYRTIIEASGEKFNDFEYIERFDFYKRAKKAHTIIATGESALYANVILKKGIVVDR